MKLILAILPTVVLTLYGQFVTKIRVGALADQVKDVGALERIILYVMDPLILSAYVVTFTASFAWFFVLERFELSLAYPVFIGVMFMAVMVGGVFFFGDQITTRRVIAVALIFAGIALGAAK